MIDILGYLVFGALGVLLVVATLGVVFAFVMGAREIYRSKL